MKTTTPYPFLGFGVGLRHRHLDEILGNHSLEWVEVISENYMAWEDGGYRKPFQRLLRVREKLPIVLHGVSLSIGSTDPIDKNYLKRLRGLIEKIEPVWVSDHMCWTGVGGENLHDLLPMPYTEEAIRLIVRKVEQVQNFLKRPILLENVSSYVEFAESEMPEWEFVAEVSERSGCGILLDVNNVYVSSRNHGFDPITYLQAIPSERVGQIHLAGHTDHGTYLVDTHSDSICDDVWRLYRWVTQNIPFISTMVEWDENIPEFSVLEREVIRARNIFECNNKRVHEATGTSARI